MTAPDELYGDSIVIRIANASRSLFVLLALAGAVAAATSSDRAAATFLIVGFVGLIVAQLVVGIAGYRRAMRAEWPKVDPIDDDEW